MTPETKNRYFQELLKTAGATMSDELRCLKIFYQPNIKKFKSFLFKTKNYR